REWMKRAFDGSVADAQDEVALLLAAGVEPQVDARRSRES
ncbi:MAG: hypothetical protein UZ18_ATM001000003, partial [Armatimonadetes bacterium OLB18]